MGINNFSETFVTLARGDQVRFTGLCVGTATRTSKSKLRLDFEVLSDERESISVNDLFERICYTLLDVTILPMQGSNILWTRIFIQILGSQNHSYSLPIYKTGSLDRAALLEEPFEFELVSENEINKKRRSLSLFGIGLPMNWRQVEVYRRLIESFERLLVKDVKILKILEIQSITGSKFSTLDLYSTPLPGQLPSRGVTPANQTQEIQKAEGNAKKAQTTEEPEILLRFIRIPVYRPPKENPVTKNVDNSNNRVKKPKRKSLRNMSILRFASCYGIGFKRTNI